jgi:hypothetical protein
MEKSVTAQFVILSVHHDNGRIVIDNLHFKYSLIGAVLMDFLDRGEISLSNRRLIPSLRKNGDPMHDMFVERIEGYSKPRRISRWVRSLSGKGWLVFKDTINSLIDKGIIRHERRLFLNIFPYNRFFHTEKSQRTGIIDGIRDVLFHDKSATRQQIMLIGLIYASRSHHILAKEKGERWILRRKCKEFMKGDTIPSEIDQIIREVNSEIDASVAAASA